MTDTTTVAPDDPAFVAHPTVSVDNLSVWFGQHVVLSELSCSFGPGVTGLLGPNGAGKTTLMRAICGLIPASSGSVSILGHDPRGGRDIQRRVALVPEEDAVPESLSPRELARYSATLSGVADRDTAIDWALQQVDLHPVADRDLGGFSKGMRQRAKIAAALVTNPDVFVLDEPLNGADPVQRLALIDLFSRLGESGRTVIVSSHVLGEVERLAPRVVVVQRGRLAAAGSHRAIRDAMADRPRRILVRSDDDRTLAASLIRSDVVAGIDIDGAHGGVVVSTSSAVRFAVELPQAAVAQGIGVREVVPLDDSLESMFTELTR